MSSDTRDGGSSTLAVNAAATVMARLLVPVFNVLLVVSIARLVGVVGLGQYALLITLFQLCEQFKSLGLTTYVVREVSRDPACAASYHRSLARIGYWGAICATPVVAAVTLAKNHLSWDAGLAAGLICAGLVLSSQVLANDAVFLALGRASYSLWIGLGENVLRFGVSICALMIWRQGVLSLVVIYAGARSVAALAGATARVRMLDPSLAPYDSALTRAMLSKAPNFLTIFVAPLVLYRMDVLLLSALSTDYEVGVYGAAVRLISVALILPDGVMTAMFATLSRVSSYDDRAQYRRWIRSAIEVLGAFMATALVGGFLIAPYVIHLLYGSKFDASIPALQILVWALIPILVNRILGDSLVAAGEQSTVARIVFIGMFASAGLYIVLIRLLGMPGAAWGFLLSSLGLCSFTAFASIRRFQIASAGPVLLALAPSVLGALAVVATHARWLATSALAAAQLAALTALIRGWNALRSRPLENVCETTGELVEFSS